MSDERELSHFDTRTIHLAEKHGEAAVPIWHTVGTHGDYTRRHDPTRAALAEKMAQLEGAAGALTTACGMAAISQTLLALLKAGDRVIAHRTLYLNADYLLKTILPKFGITTEFIDMRDPDKLKQALAKPARVVYFEPFSNPTLDVIDVAEVAEIAHSAGALVVVDNTFLSPALLQPIALGADIVVHSATKYLNGHGDALAGIICTAAKEHFTAIGDMQYNLGGVMSPMTAFLLLRGLKTLSVRMARHCENAMRVAQFLKSHKAVKLIHYPGLPDDSGHAAAAKMCKNGFGGMMSIELADRAAAERFGSALKVFDFRGSLGDTNSLAMKVWPNYIGAERAIGEGLVRLSVGIENIDDLLADLEQALAKA